MIDSAYAAQLQRARDTEAALAAASSDLQGAEAEQARVATSAAEAAARIGEIDEQAAGIRERIDQYEQTWALSASAKVPSAPMSCRSAQAACLRFAGRSGRPEAARQLKNAFRAAPRHVNSGSAKGKDLAESAVASALKALREGK